MNLKDWILNYLNLERKILIKQINQYQKIKTDELLDNEGRKELIQMMIEIDRQHYFSYSSNMKNELFQRTLLMFDNVQGHMPEFLPGSKGQKKYSESRIILTQIESQLADYMSKPFNSKMNNMVEVTIQEEVLVEELDADGETVTVPKTETKTIMKNAALEELDQIITLADTLDHEYCFAYELP